MCDFSMVVLAKVVDEGESEFGVWFDHASGDGSWVCFEKVFGDLFEGGVVLAVVY
jgi:hypothetical protein